MSSVLLNTDLPIQQFKTGKVRDSYYLDDKLLLITTDRISAYDSVLPAGIPDKGKVLNQISAFWFEQTKHLIPNHLIEVVYDPKQLDAYLPKESRFAYPDYLAGRAIVAKKAKRLPIECVVRGYLSGSAWEEYQQSGTVFDMPLPKDFKESQEFPEPLFTPTTKADSGHDEPLSMDEMVTLVGLRTAKALKEKTLEIYNYARQYALERGIIIADTKMEFGLVNDELILIDELLTPDSSRFWDASQYQPGKSQPSFDKQPVRDWLVESGWDKEPPAPTLPPEVVEATTNSYRKAYERLAGKELK